MADLQWVPSNEFEEAAVGYEPHNHFIYGTNLAGDSQVYHPRPAKDMRLFEKIKKKERDVEELLACSALTNSERQKLRIIHTVQKIAGTKALDELPTTEDWDNGKNRARETVAMMRSCGHKPSLEQPFDETKTIATRPIPNKVDYMKRGAVKIPLFYGSEIFKPKEVRPRIPVDNSATDESGSMDDIANVFSDLNLNHSIESNFSNPMHEDSFTDGAIYLRPGKNDRLFANEETDIPYELFTDSTMSSSNMSAYSLSANSSFDDSFGPYFKGYTKPSRKTKKTTDNKKCEKSQKKK